MLNTFSHFSCLVPVVLLGKETKKVVSSKFFAVMFANLHNYISFATYYINFATYLVS